MRMSARLSMALCAAASVAVSVSACQTVPPNPGVPAVLSGTSAKTVEGLSRVVSSALNGRTVTLAPDVLTKSPTLIIELVGTRSVANNHMDGRRADRPDHFALSLLGGKCVLTHVETDKSYTIPDAKCRAVE